MKQCSRTGDFLKKKTQKTEEIIRTPNDFQAYTLLAADLSLRRPGFCLIDFDKSKQNPISNVRLYSVDNKTKKKLRGEMLHENAEKLREILQGIHEPIFLVREKSINNCNSKMSRSGSAARSGVSEVVGIMDLIAWETLHVEWDEIYPVTVKKAVTGSGKSEKTVVAECLPLYYGQENALSFRNDDESDAAAVAIAWLISHGQIKQIEREVESNEEEYKETDAV